MGHGAQACGFELIFEAAAEGGSEEGFAVLPDDCDLALVQAALQLLGQPQPSPSSHQLGGQSALTRCGGLCPQMCRHRTCEICTRTQILC